MGNPDQSEPERILEGGLIGDRTTVKYMVPGIPIVGEAGIMRNTRNITLFLLLIFQTTLGANPALGTAGDRFIPLHIEKAKVHLNSSLQRVESPDQKYWYAQETVRQLDSPLFDTTIYVKTMPGYFLKIFAQGHTRAWAVDVRWTDEAVLTITVEWGHQVTSTYVVNVTSADEALGGKGGTLTQSPVHVVVDPYRDTWDHDEGKVHGMGRFFIDLTDDGKPELFIVAYALVGNSVGYFHVFTQGHDGTYKELGEVGLPPDGCFELLKGRHHGVRDIRTCLHASAERCSLVTYEFDGAAFREGFRNMITGPPWPESECASITMESSGQTLDWAP